MQSSSGTVKKIIRGLAIAIIFCAVLTTAYGSNVYGFSQEISLSNSSTSSFPQNGMVSIAFDDSLQSQYDYALPLLEAKGVHATFYVISDLVGQSGHLTVSELQNLQSNGNEIGSHSKTHPDFTGISDAQIQQECSVSKQVLQSYGLTINNFAYPYGDCNTHTDSIVNQYYRSARSAYSHPSYIMQLPTTQFNLLATAGNKQTPITDLQDYVNNVRASKGWAIIVFHDVVPSPGDWQTSTQVLSQFLDYLEANGVEVLTVNQALDMGSRDVDITSVVPSCVQAAPGTIIEINVTARNEGAMTETFNITTYYDNNEIGTQTVTDLASGANITLTFGWNTGAVPFGDYTIKAIASTVPEEIDTADNTFVDGTVTIFGPPMASFTCYPSNTYINQPVLFDASSSKSNGGTITDYMWNFDDGNITSTSNAIASHTFVLARNYNVALTVTNTEGLNGSASELVTAEVAVAGIFSVASNSTVSDLSFNLTSLELSFTVAGPSGTTGLTRVTIAKTLVANVTNLKVFLDEKPLQYSVTETGDSWVVSFTYTHSTHYITLALNPSRLRGDVNNDGRVNMLDVSMVAAAFGSKPTDTRWNSAADLASNGIIDIRDIAIVARELGNTV
jgi:peptidoglycan/xylan/chitin deacetylase (PgdA/CDA1 family)/PKD repeat protein